MQNFPDVNGAFGPSGLDMNITRQRFLNCILNSNLPVPYWSSLSLEVKYGNLCRRKHFVHPFKIHSVR